ncbi:MAG TPA: restriction endonuclease [Croceibacterium sp.]|nr:restriction endonuclease [Croceibacterium sp.]
MITIPRPDLPTSDLRIDAVYQGGRAGNAGDDPLGPLLQVSNSGGFRYRGSIDALTMVVLTTSLDSADWPDAIDPETGTFTYFGDNRNPGRGLHETPRRGNELLRRAFDLAHGSPAERAQLPPIFAFANVGPCRDVRFLGLVVPGAPGLRPSEDLVAVWKAKQGARFQNYRAIFTILDAGVISRKWLDEVVSGNPVTNAAPKAWKQWILSGTYKPLTAERTVEYRTKAEQLPSDDAGRRLISFLHAYFGDQPHRFEGCAAAISRLALPEVASLDVTRPSRDGGRDAVGRVRLGRGPGAILIDFALEAKCYAPAKSVGVRELSRLISRLRHRQFGVLVTTSFVDRYAYKEIKEDQHPIIIIAAGDIVQLLRDHGLGEISALQKWLVNEFPPTA